ncbi:hypothetical protein FIU87_05635 [Bacillus sp. THAF10]|uniref:DUF1761 domain-containing protein n=1 Tax=Bacillus sp. THAF10 TaxID=2587848 RepID=UPI001267FC0C|nr:DUF1761 domain-containing protein [Bacillus sp. THAF10]QFT88113.1 hypothetical protein FIU87_05635 [Bacillus sp. THAF10]
MDVVEGISFLSVLLAAVSAFLIGGIWYTVLFGKAWMKIHNFSDEELKKSAPRVFGGSFVLAIIISYSLAMFIGPNSTASFGVFAGFMAGAFFVAAALGITYLFERKPFKLFLIDAGYHIVTFTLMGFILGFMS